MNDVGEPDPSEESQLQSIVEQYLARSLAGDNPDPSDYILDNPSLAAKLESRLEVVQLLRSAAASDRTRPSAPLRCSGIPEVIGRYQIDGLLGSGASAAVYRAYDPKFQRWVALKVFKGVAPIGSDASERFERDARIAAQLRHPNIVPLHDAGEHGDLRYIDMELIPGETLESRIRRSEGPWEPRAAAELVHKLASALDYAHRVGIVHRDVKPSNVLLDERGEPQLTDFGSARLGTDHTLTADGQIIGTPMYMPPEQAEGSGHRADPRSDVYSLGVILYRLLTGRPPFEQTDSMVALLGRIISESPPKPRTINPRAPRDLETICLKALEKRPDDRFATAAALADELKRWLNGEPLSIRPPGAIERVRRWARRHRPLARVLTTSAVVLLLMVGAFGWAVWDQREQRHDAELREAEHRERARAAGELERLENERRIELEAWSLLVRARKRLAIPTAGRRDEVVALLRDSAELRRRLPAGEAAERLDLETRSVFAASLGVPELRIEPCRTPLPNVFTAAWRAAIHPDGNSMVVGTHLGPVRWTRGQPFPVPDGLDEKKPRPRLAYHPEGTYLAFAPGDGGLQIWNETATHKLADLDPSTGIEFLDFAFTEKDIRACRADGAILSWSLPGWTGPVERKLDTGTLTAARFNDDASLVAVGTSDGTVHWCRTEEGKSLRQMATGRFGIDALAWSPDSYHIAVGTSNGDVQVWSRDGQLRREIPTTESGVGAVHFHRNGQWLLAGGRPGAMHVWNAHTGEPLLNGPDIPWCFSRDGTRLAGGNAEGVSFLELAPPTVVKQLSGHRSFIDLSAWSHDSRFLATLDRQFELRIWDVARGVSTTRFTVAPSEYAISNAALAPSADGAYVVYASSGEKGALEIFDVAKGERIASHPLSDGFGRLGHDGARFVFVREESSGKSLRTVACSFVPGERALEWHELRPLVPDEILFHSSTLTPDGRYYLWAGPRTPAERMRVELYDVALRKRVRRIDCPHDTALQSWGSTISADGRQIWIQDRVRGYMRHDVFDNEPPTNVLFAEHSSLDRKWYAASGFADARLGKIPIQLLRTAPSGPARLQFMSGDLDGIGTASFSPDSRYVAWIGPGHHMTVAELPALAAKVQEFERSLAE